jgi:hypothetical protein
MRRIAIFRAQVVIASIFGLLMIVSVTSAQGPCQPAAVSDDVGLADPGHDWQTLMFFGSGEDPLKFEGPTGFDGPDCGDDDGYAGRSNGLDGCTGSPVNCG